MANNNESMQRLADKLSPKQNRIQLILAAVAAAAVFLRTQDFHGASVILILTLSSLAMLFFIGAYASPPADGTRLDIFITRLMGWGCSIAVLGILFTLQDYKGSVRMFMISGGVLLICIVMKLMRSEVKTDITKAVILLAVICALFFTPKETLHQMNILHLHPRDATVDANSR